jgi:uncharacterized protein (TIGR00661 family)
MDQKFVEKTILVVPLDWGLGHAARCIPLIKHFQSYHFTVIVAAEGAVKTLLKSEFPLIEFLPLPGYNIRYSKNRSLFAIKLLSQVPTVLMSICKEHLWLKKVVKNHKIDAVISDNRFGLYHAKIPSVYITHQLSVYTGNQFTGYLATSIHHWFIRKFTHCWVPDFAGIPNAGGQLSHPKKIPGNVQYLGCLSRFEKLPVARRYKLVIVLSGPEPQRTIFEELLLKQLTNYHGQTLFVRGLPASNKPVAINHDANIVLHNHLPAETLSKAIQQAEIVISRSGYTTVMDLLKLGQRAILVPTPGQGEQEYLARWLSQKRLFYTTPQSNFSLTAALAAAEHFPFAVPELDMEQYKKVLYQFAKTL